MWSRYTIFEIIKGMDEGRVLVPAIQRDFVWKLNQVETLFNSIANGYPIGMFLFWGLGKDEANNLGLYRFVKDYRDGGVIPYQKLLPLGRSSSQERRCRY